VKCVDESDSILTPVLLSTDIIMILTEGTIVLRPALDGVASDDELLEMMDKCWMEDPADRPDFGQIKATLRRLNK